MVTVLLTTLLHPLHLSTLALALASILPYLHLEPLLHGGSTLQVFLGGGDVLLLGLLREVDHVGGKQGLAVDLEVGLVSIEHAVEPGQQLVGTVVGVQDDGDLVGRRQRADEVRRRHRARHRRLLPVVRHPLSGLVRVRECVSVRE